MEAALLAIIFASLCMWLLNHFFPDNNNESGKKKNKKFKKSQNRGLFARDPNWM